MDSSVKIIRSTRRYFCRLSIVSSQLPPSRITLTIYAHSLKTSLLELGLELNENLSWESCDEEYQSLRNQMLSGDLTALIEKPFAKDQNIILTGAVLTEAISAAYWSDTLLVYLRSLR